MPPPLLLIPTRAEATALGLCDEHALRPLLSGGASWRDWPVELAGFGPIDAACGASTAFQRHPKIAGVLLLGLGGTYDALRCPPGSVAQIQACYIHGLGCGDEPAWIPVEAMGLPPAAAAGRLPFHSREASSLSLPASAVTALAAEGITVCAASHDPGEARQRNARYPTTLIEDMETFAVARAARLAGLPWAAWRAVSNRAGDRDKGNWRIQEALAALAQAMHALREAWP